MTWEMRTFENVSTFIDYRGRTPKKQSSGIPLITAKNISNRYLDFSVKEYISKEDYDGWMTRGIPLADDLLFTTEAPLGKVSLLGTSKKIALAQRLLAIRCNKNLLLPNFLLYAISFPNVWGQILQRSSGSTVKGIRSKELKKVKIPLPPLETQKRIVALLDKAQELIDKRKEQIALMDELIQSLFYDMFGDPVTNPMGWEESKIDDSCFFVKDGPHKSLDYVDSGIPFVSVKDIIKGYWDFSNVKHISKEVFEINKQRCQPEYGDILYTKGGTTGYAKLVDIELDFLNWVHLAVLKFEDSKLNGKFFETMLNSNYCYQQSQRYTRGIANRDLVLGEMKKIKHYIPPIELQNQFADRVKEIESQKQTMQTSLKEMEDNFNSLMQRAFKGEI